MVEFELEKPYSTKEVAEMMNVSYVTFRNNRSKYEEKLSKGYEWELVKRRYIFHKKIGNIYLKKSEELYNEIYLPRVITAIEKQEWNTASGVTNMIWTEEVMNQVQHLMSRAYDYVREVLGNEFDITEKKYAACMGTGQYPRFMTEEEVKEWNKIKFTKSKETGEKLIELTEQWASGMIKTAEYNQQVKNLASGSFIEALGKWIETYGYIPVRINHYERKSLEIENKEFDWEE